MLLPIDKSAFAPAACDGVPEWGGISEHGGISGRDSCLMQLTHTLRLWPQRVKGEGHFAALLQKDGHLYDHDTPYPKNGLIKGITEKELEDFILFCRENLHLSAGNLSGQLGGAVGMDDASVLIRFGENLYLVPAQLPDLKGLKVLRPGLHLGELKKNRFEPSHALALALSPKSAARVWNLRSDSKQAAAYLNGQTFIAEGEKGWYLICVDGFGLGWGKLAGGVMKNHYPKGLRIHNMNDYKLIPV